MWGLVICLAWAASAFANFQHRPTVVHVDIVQVHTVPPFGEPCVIAWRDDRLVDYETSADGEVVGRCYWEDLYFVIEADVVLRTYSEKGMIEHYRDIYGTRSIPYDVWCRQ